MSSLTWLLQPWRWPLEILLISLFMTESVAENNQTCYFPSGIVSGGKPCHPNAKSSGCCGPGFECLSNKVCQTTPSTDASYKYDLYRSGCTDPTFQDPACPRFCFGADDHREAGQGLQLCDIDTGLYCCRRDGLDCCSNSTLLAPLGKGEVVTTIPNHTTHPTHTATATPTHPAVSGDSRQPAYARDTIIGAGAGFAAAAFIFLGGGCFWLARRRKGYRDRDRKSTGVELDTMNSSKLAIHKEISVSVSAVDEPLSPIELETTQRHELETTPPTSSITEQIERFELDGSPSEDERPTTGRQAQEESRQRALAQERLASERPWEETPWNEMTWDEPSPPERPAPGIPTSEIPAPGRPAPERPAPQVPVPEMTTVARPVPDITITVSETPTPVRPTPETTIPDPPIPERPAPTPLSESAASDRPAPTVPHMPVTERPAPEKSTDGKMTDRPD